MSRHLLLLLFFTLLLTRRLINTRRGFNLCASNHCKCSFSDATKSFYRSFNLIFGTLWVATFFNGWAMSGTLNLPTAHTNVKQLSQ